MLEGGSTQRKSGVQVTGLAGCFLAVFILVGSFGGMLYLIIQALEGING